MPSLKNWMHCTRRNLINISPTKTLALLPANYSRAKVSRIGILFLFIVFKLICYIFGISFLGIITHLYSDYGYINENLYFSREMARSLQLQEGYMVVYIARKICDDIPVQIYAIKSIVQETWGYDSNLQSASVNNQSLKTLSTHEKWLHGVVVGVECSNFLIETNDAKIKTLEVELSRIDCTFLPVCLNAGRQFCRKL